MAESTSTPRRILRGACMPDAGAQTLIDGPIAAKNLGVSVIRQATSLAPNPSVARNVFTGRSLRRLVGTSRDA